MLDVFITVDTEVWPRRPDWHACGLSQDIQRDLYGVTPAGAFGVPYQIEVLNAHGLKAVFFIEALFACAVGLEPLRKLVELVQGRGHEVQLHLHTEWLRWLNPSPLPGRTGQNMKDFSEDEQALLIAKGLANLQACGAQNVCAFRAGNYGANAATLRALARQGIRFDTSHNTPYLDSDCGLRTESLLLQPAPLHGVWEYPVTFFCDWPNHYRHAQLCACSTREMTTALLEAWRRGWSSFVVVSHSFELLKRRKDRVRPALPDRIIIRRFERLCRFLADNRDKFRTVGFADIRPEFVPPAGSSVPLQSRVRHTAWRVVEQLARRVI